MNNLADTFKKKLASLTFDERNQVNVPLGNDGRVHTHWRQDGNLGFSDGDYTAMLVEVYTKGFYGNNYLINRNGDIYRGNISKKHTLERNYVTRIR